jgi:hypothetical protein
MDCNVPLKLAVALVAELTETVQAPGPVQAPLHPENSKLAAGVAVKVTWVPEGKLALQVPGQLMPAGVLVMVPFPGPADVTANWKPVPGPPWLTNPRHPARNKRPTTSPVVGSSFREVAMKSPPLNRRLGMTNHGFRLHSES